MYSKSDNKYLTGFVGTELGLYESIVQAAMIKLILTGLSI